MAAKSELLVSKVRDLAKTGLAIGSPLLTGSLLGGCGKEYKTHTLKEAEEIARSDYDRIFYRASPAGKFVLQFLRTTQVGMLEKQTDSDFGNDFFQFRINSGCLENTAYDIAGGIAEAQAEGSSGSLIFGFSSSSASVEAHMPTAGAFAQIDPKNPNVLLVKSGNARSVDLRFSGLRETIDHLEPLNAQTRNILDTNGCATGPEFSYEVVTEYYPHTSSYIH